MSLLTDNLHNIAEYVRSVEELSIPAVVQKYDDGRLQEDIGFFKYPFLDLFPGVVEDLEAIYPEEISINESVIYYMGQASYYIFMISDGNAAPGSFAKAHQGVLNAQSFTTAIVDLFDKRIMPSDTFNGNIYGSLISLDRAALYVEELLNKDVNSSDYDAVNIFHKLLLSYQDRFKIVENAIESNGIIFKEISTFVFAMQNSIAFALDLLNSKNYSSALREMDKFSLNNNDLLKASEKLRP